MKEEEIKRQYERKMLRLLLADSYQINDYEAERLLCAAKAVNGDHFQQSISLEGLEEEIQRIRTAINIRKEARIRSILINATNVFAVTMANLQDRKEKLSDERLREIAEEAKRLTNILEEVIIEDREQLQHEISKAFDIIRKEIKK